MTLKISNNTRVIGNESKVIAAIRAARAMGTREINVSNLPRGGQRAEVQREEPTRSSVELFGDYVEAKILGREKQFLKGLSLDQFTRLAESLERSTS